MGDRKFTLIELHIDGTQLGTGSIANALPIGGSEGETDVELEDDEEAAADDSGGKGTLVGALIGLVALVAIGVAVKKYSGDDEAPEPEAEPDVIVN